MRIKTFPLSFSQKRLWFLDQLDPGTGTYNIPLTYKLKGELNVNALESSLNEIVRRHEILRTNFIVVNGEPRQRIDQFLQSQLSIIDTTDIEAQQWIDQEANTGFDLVHDPLIRWKLLRLGIDEHILLITFHHIVADGWSIGIMNQEIATLYQAFISDKSAPLPELEWQYSDFSQWQQEMLQGETLEKQLAYWKKQLEGPLPILELPTDRPRTAAPSYQGSSYKFEFSPELTKSFRALCQSEGCTLYMGLVAAFSTLLARYTGQEDIILGTPIANRHHSQVEPLIGYFLNLLALRIDLSGRPNFRELLRQVYTTTLGAYENQDIPFERLLEELHVERDFSHTPLFQVMINMDNSVESTAELPGIKVKFTEFPKTVAEFKLDLSLTIIESNEKLMGIINYRNDLFGNNFIQKLVSHWSRLLEAVVAAPEEVIWQLPFLTDPELEQLLVTWNKTQRKYEEEHVIHRLFETQVGRTPNAIAVSIDNKAITYQELNNRANQLAHYLRSLGVTSGVFVGIYVERSIDMVVCLLAVLKAGGIYVPLDPDYPIQRLQFIQADTKFNVLVTQETLIKQMEWSEHITSTICLDRERKLLERYSKDNVSTNVTPENIAYVIYTSGSTGKPKGVLVAHQNAAAFLLWAKEIFSGPSMDGVLAATSICFDLSIFELFGTLISGGRIILAKNILELPQLIKHGITLVNTVPSAMIELLRMGTLPATVQIVNLAGEPLSQQLVKQLYDQTNVIKVFDLYGPSETTTYSTFTLRSIDGVNTIGRPIANTAIYILDKNLQPVPFGLPGELYIGGAGVTVGYLNRPDLTSEKFIKDPFSDQVDGRLYRTGDLARYLQNGDIEFLGRVDNQVKLRGFRIELSEVEMTLAQYPKIRQAVAIVREDTPGDKRLVAYVVPIKEDPSLAGELRSFLKTVLPDYMIPSAFVSLFHIPMTVNGKVDRKALPAPTLDNIVQQEFISPRNKIENTIAEKWREIFRLQAVGVYDNFFEMGGHSLLATQMISHLNKYYSIELPITHLFKNPTVAGLAKSIQILISQENFVQSAHPNFVLHDQELPLSFSQKRLWFLDQLDPGTGTYNIPLTYKLKGELNVNALESSLNEIVRRHEILRTNFIVVNGEPRQRIDQFLQSQLSIIDTTDIEAQQWIDQEANTGFDLVHDPLIRWKLLRLGIDEHILLITFHHIVADGWSIGIMNQEIATLYQAFISDKSAPLPELEWQYSDFSQWQQEMLQGETLEKQLAYWKKQLEGPLPILELPTDRPRTAAPSYQGSSYKFEFSPELTKSFRALCQSEGCTLYMGLVAAFSTLLARYTGQEDIILGTPIANRHHSQVEPLIGYFLNLLALRIDLSGRPNFRELLRQVYTTTLGAYENQDIPFERLLEELHVERDFSHTPLFQVMINMLNPNLDLVRLPGLETTLSLNLEVGSKFDLTLYVWDRDAIELNFIYSTDLFDQYTIQLTSKCLQTLVQNIVSDPNQNLLTVPLASTDLLQHLRKQAHTVQVPVPFESFNVDEIEQSIQERFRYQARRFSHQIAIKTNNDQVTYLELDEASDKTANTIIKSSGTRPGVIALLFSHDISMIVGLLGALKAGKTYIPLDPSYPTDRVKFMLKDSEAQLLVTDSKNLSLARELAGSELTLIRVDDLEDVEPNIDFPQTSPDSIAYILYTSGSTGEPKGVIQSHRNVLHHIRQYTNNLHINHHDRLTLFSSYSFDAAVMDIFGALLNGAQLYPIDIKNEGLEHVPQYLIDNAITIYHSTPTLYRYFNATLENEIFSDIRLVVLGGEAVLRSDVDLFKKHFSLNCIFVNGLGPTESTISLQYFIDHQTKLDRNMIPVGFPVGDTNILLLNRDGVDNFIFGEIAIRSNHIALGYWNRQELTTRSFLPDPEGGDKRIYKTGDMGRLLTDGSIEYVGRIDTQVKIRGYRIELGEIETLLIQYQGIRAAIVIAREDTPGNRYLASYLINEPGISVSIEALRKYLISKLPRYMVPDSLIFLDTLPLTPTGKIDRRLLPAPEKNRNQFDTTYIPARNETETKLEQIWRAVLGQGPIGIFDNFFDLGGHSLLAMQIITRIHKVFQVEVPLSALFREPTIANLTLLIDDLSTGAVNEQKPLVPHNETNPALSYAQERLWLIDQIFSGNSVYNISLAVRIEGEINTDALTLSLNAMFRRHEILRTYIISVDGRPVQEIVPVAEVDLPVLDWQGRDQQDLLNYISRDAAIYINPSNFPLLRARLLKLANNEYIFTINCHHIIIDEWSTELFFRELKELYEAEVEGRVADLTELSIQYADYALWQRKWLQGETLEQLVNYWTQKLEGMQELELPSDRTRPAVQTFQGLTYTTRVDYELSGKLKELARAEAVTLNTLLLAVFDVLLHRYTQQEDIVVGMPIASRNRVELEGLIGFFVNTLVVRTDLSGEPTFRETLKRVKQTLLEAFEHQDLPFEKLVEVLNPIRDLSRTPLYHVMFVMQDNSIEIEKLGTATVTPLPVETHRSDADITLYMREIENQLEISLEYSTDLYDKERIERLVSHYKNLLEDIVTSPEKKLRDLELLTEVEMQQIMEYSNHTKKSIPTDTCIHHLFEEQVDRNPDKVAVVFGEEQLTYCELNERANQLGNYLRKLGVGPEVLVGICLERSMDMIVGVLGILKAGGAYVPLDPNQPQVRLLSMLTASDAVLLITQQRIAEIFSDFNSRVVLIDTEWKEISEESCTNLKKIAKANNLAYAIFTSGTTGRPKSVGVEHRNLVNAYFAWADAYSLASIHTHLQMANFSFDVFSGDYIRALCSGAKLIICPFEYLFFPDKLYNLMYEHKVECAEFVPAILKPLSNYIREAEVSLDFMKIIICGSDTWYIGEYEELRAMLNSGTRLINSFGVTEATIDSSYYEDGDLKISEERVVPIGRPFTNTKLYLLDTNLRPIPIGVPGELYIGGDGVARGYLNESNLNADKFLPDPFIRNGNSRIYRTGDLARWLPDGNIEFIGRIDNQVKIRGNRIELGEIETILRQIEGVQEAIVIAREDIPGAKYLCAYLVPSSIFSLPEQGELRNYLRKLLPEYMVPTSFVFLDAVPLTLNGKINRKLLPAPEASRVPLFSPRDLLEQQLLVIWKRVLQTEAISLNDDFFALGGNSLLAMQLISQVENDIRCKLPLSTLFQTSTFEDLAKVIRKSQISSKQWSPLVPFGKSNPKQSLYCIHPVGGHVLSYAKLAANLGDLPVCAIQARGTDINQIPDTSVEAMASFYTKELLKESEPPYMLGGWSFGAIVAFEMARQLMQQGHKISLLASFDRALDLSEDEMPILESDYVSIFIEYLLKDRNMKKMNINEEIVREYPEDSQLKFLLDKSIQWNILPPDFSLTYLVRTLELYKVNAQALVMYDPKPYEGDLDLFVTNTTLESYLENGSNAFLGWDKYISGNIRVHKYEGDHFTLLQNPLLAQDIKRVIKNIQ